MSNGQINFFNDGVDDVLLPEGVPSFEGGMFSNVRANLLQPNQSKLLVNCDVDKLGKLRTRRGTILLGTGPPSGVANTVMQGLTSYQTSTDNYIVAANNGRLWKFTDTGPTGWVQIATGGIVDNDEIHIYRTGLINNPAVVGPPAIPAGYMMGDTVLTVDNVGGAAPAAGAGRVEIGEKLYFMNNLRTDWYEYTIAGVTPAAPSTSPVTQIVLEEPGLVFNVKDNWKFTVTRPALVNNGAGYPGAYTGAITIDGYIGVVNTGEFFVVKSENIRHNITAHTETGGNTTSIDGASALQAAYVVDPNVPIHFAQGNDQLFFCDGVGDIYAWNGQTTMRIGAMSTLDFLTGSALHQTYSVPPTGVNILVWFQNRLIASGIAAEPDAIYFSDFFDPTSWDSNYQKIRIGGGESDPITGLVPWTDYNMLVFKKNAIYIINLDPSQNPFPDDSTLLVSSYNVKQIHKRIGCPAPLTAVQVGGGSTTPGSDVFFLDGDKKLHSIRRVLAAETQQEVGQAISLPVQDVVDQTNIAYIHRATAMYHNEHYILALPTLPRSDPTRPNMCVVYNMLTQSWCGNWRWRPTCFAIRNDVGAFSKLIFGGTYGNVVQWMDDLSLNEEISTSYRDYVSMGSSGDPIETIILTRGITFGDAYSFKTGLSVEFEFDESVSAEVTIFVILDKITQPEPITAFPFTTLSVPRIRLGTPEATLPFTLPGSPSMVRVAFDLQRYGTWRELQFQINSPMDKLAIRSIRVTGFIDTLQLQTVPVDWVTA